MRIVPISHAAFTAFLVGIITLALFYAAITRSKPSKCHNQFSSPPGLTRWTMLT
jgi:hypothetical protein